MTTLDSVSAAQNITGHTYGNLPPGNINGGNGYNGSQNTWVHIQANGTITLTASNQTVTYSTAPNSSAVLNTTYTFSCSDGCSSSVLTGGPSFAFTGGPGTSTSGNYNVGSWTITPSGATDNNGYTINYVTGSLTVTAKALTISGMTADNKTYDAATTATQHHGADTLNGVVTNDVVTFNTGAATGAFADANAGNGKTVTASGITLGGADAGNYMLTQPTATANITAASLTVTASNQNKTYGFGGTSAALGTSAFTVAGLQGTDAIDTATLSTNATSSTSGNYTAGSWDITPAAAHFSSGLSGNYAITYVTDAGGLTVAQKSLTVSATGVNRVYDATIGATVTLSDNHLGSDVITDSYVGAAFLDKNAGNGKTVNVTGISIGGADAGNYTLAANTASTTANISRADLTVSGLTVSSRAYDGTDAATLGGAASVTALGGDAVTLGGVASGVFADKNAGNGKAIIVSGISITGGADAGNYNLIQQQGLTANITPLAIAVTADSASKIAGHADPVFSYHYTGSVVGDFVSFTGLLARDPGQHAGHYAITIGMLAATGNYTIGTFGPGVFTITGAAAPATATPDMDIASLVDQVWRHRTRLEFAPARQPDSQLLSSPSTILLPGSLASFNTLAPSEGDTAPAHHASAPDNRLFNPDLGSAQADHKPFILLYCPAENACYMM